VTDEAKPLLVLVVEDHRMVAESLAGALRSTPGIDVLGVVSTAAAAVRAVSENPPDVVLMDYRLPDGDGIETARRLQVEHSATRVVILTASDDHALMLAAIEAGCAGYVTKDRSLEELVAAVRAAHAGTTLLSPDLLMRLVGRRASDLRQLGDDLTVRETEVLTMLAVGRSNAAIAGELGISVNTVRNHVQNVLGKLQAHSKLEAVAVAVREGVISYPA